MPPTVVRITWRSGQDGRRHAYESTARGSGALCGVRLEGERFNRPDQPKHSTCMAILDAREPELVQRMLGGDR